MLNQKENKRDTIVDRVFRKALQEFHMQLISSYSVLMKVSITWLIHDVKGVIITIIIIIIIIIMIGIQSSKTNWLVTAITADVDILPFHLLKACVAGGTVFARARVLARSQRWRREKYHSISFPFSPRLRCSSAKTLLVLTMPLATQANNLFVFASTGLEMGRDVLGNSIIVALISVGSRLFQIIFKAISQWLDCLGSWNKTNDPSV